MTKRIMIAAVSLLLVALLVGCGAPASEPTPTPTPISEKPYYEGKTITIVVPTAAGGSTDILGRTMARFLPRYIPGNPPAVIRNMTGAAGMAGTNLVWNSKPDGTTLVFTTTGSLMQNLTRPKGLEYHLEEMHPIFATPAGQVMVGSRRF